MTAKKALLIGIDSYVDPGIKTLFAPLEDIERLEKVLRSDYAGFEVETCINPGLQHAQEQISKLYENASPEDLLLLYFAGHGMPVGGDLFLALKHTNVARPHAGSVPGAYVRQQLLACASRRKVVILDCCYAGRFLPDDLLSRGIPVVENRALVESTFRPAGTGTYVLAASLSDQSAYEVRDPQTGTSHSIYTNYLIEGITTGAAAPQSDTITPAHLHSYVHGRMKPGGLSEPVFMSLGEGEALTICQNPVPPIEPAVLKALHGEDSLARRGAVLSLTGQMMDNPHHAQAARIAATLHRRLEPSHPGAAEETDYRIRQDISDALTAFAALGANRATETKDELNTETQGPGESASRQEGSSRTTATGNTVIPGTAEGSDGSGTGGAVDLQKPSWSWLRWLLVAVVSVAAVIYGALVFQQWEKRPQYFEWTFESVADLFLLRDPSLRNDETPPGVLYGRYTGVELRTLICRLRSDSDRDATRQELSAGGAALFSSLLDGLRNPEAIGCDGYVEADAYRIKLGLLIALNGILDAAETTRTELIAEVVASDIEVVARLANSHDETMGYWAKRLLDAVNTRAVAPPASPDGADLDATNAHKTYYLKPLNPTEFESVYSRVKTNRLLTGLYLSHSSQPSAAYVLRHGDEVVMQSMQAVQVDRFGWSDVGAHFYVSPTGNIIPGRSLDDPPAAIAKANGSSSRGPVFVELLLDGDTETPNTEQRRALVGLLEVFQSSHGIDIKRDVFEEAGFARSIDPTRSGPGANIHGAEIANWFAVWGSTAPAVNVETGCDTAIFSVGGAVADLNDLGQLVLTPDALAVGEPLHISFRAKEGFAAKSRSCLSIHVCEQRTRNFCSTVETYYRQTGETGLEFDLPLKQAYADAAAYRIYFDLIETQLGEDLSGIQRYGASMTFQVLR